jgi:hypothetical protein
MKINHNLAAALLTSFAQGWRRPPSITDGNRIHTERAPRGSALEAERIAAAERRRRQRAAKRSQSSGEAKS